MYSWHLFKCIKDVKKNGVSRSQWKIFFDICSSWKPLSSSWWPPAPWDSANCLPESVLNLALTFCLTPSSLDLVPLLPMLNLTGPKSVWRLDLASPWWDVEVLMPGPHASAAMETSGDTRTSTEPVLMELTQQNVLVPMEMISQLPRN